VVAGPARLRADIQAAIAEALADAGEPARIRADAAAMRGRIGRELAPDGPWDVKHRPGGLMEVEFIAQVLQLIHARADPGICSPTTRVALSRLAVAGLISGADAAMLIHAEHLWRTIQDLVRITLGRGAPAELPDVAARPLLAATGTVDPVQLGATMEEAAREVRAAFIRLVGEIGE
jgi:glutamate-ammonia-ligase adenylyltransferase